MPVDWEKLARNAKGYAAETNVWNANGIPLQANRTNLVIMTVATTSSTPAFGGNAKFPGKFAPPHVCGSPGNGV